MPIKVFFEDNFCILLIPLYCFQLLRKTLMCELSLCFDFGKGLDTLTTIRAEREKIISLLL